MITNSVPKDVVVMYNHALEMSSHGDQESALKEYRRAIDAYPNFTAAYNNIGEIYARMGETEKAISSYLDALKIEKHHRVLLNLGVEHFNRKNYEFALKYFTESIVREPQFLEGNFYAGLVHYTMNDYKKAERLLRAVTDIDKRHVKANYLLAHIYYEWKQYSRTIECLDRIKDLADDKSFINRFYGFCSFYMGRYEDAVKYLSAALECKPEYARFKKYLENISYENKMKEVGDLEKAISDLEAELAVRDVHIIDLTKLSMLYIFKGEYKKAEKLLQTHKKKLA